MYTVLRRTIQAVVGLGIVSLGACSSNPVANVCDRTHVLFVEDHDAFISPGDTLWLQVGQVIEIRIGIRPTATQMCEEPRSVTWTVPSESRLQVTAIGPAKATLTATSSGSASLVASADDSLPIAPTVRIFGLF